MATPKKKHSKMRTRRRRSNWKIMDKPIATCSHCGEPKQSHRICPSCGYYNNMEVKVIS